MHAPGERCRAGWAAAPGPVHNAGNECPGPTEAGFVVLSPGRCRPAAKRDQTHHNPGSPRPPAQRRPSPAPCGESFCPMHRCRRRNPAYHESAVHGRAGPAGGGNEKPRIPDAKPSGSYSVYGWAERSPRRIPRPWPAPPSGGLRGGGNSFQRFSSSVQPKSL